MRVAAIISVLLLIACLGGLAGTAAAQELRVSGRVVLDSASSSAPASSVVWLTPLSAEDPAPLTPIHAVLQQKNKTFEPHFVVITKGSTVEFPNRDPWFHNVFSLFNGKRFDLGLYEAGSSRTVHFDREGVSYIFCNIHPEMSAVVVVLASPYFSVPGKSGEFSIGPVPPGKYMLHVWSENALPPSLQALSREIELTDAPRSVGTIPIHATKPPAQHKNKYGQDYEPPAPDNPIYMQH